MASQGLSHPLAMAITSNSFWGAHRIHDELLKLGVDVSQAAIGRYLPRRPKTPSPIWRSFLLTDTLAIDMFIAPRRSGSCIP
jgi:hypothetical protein